MSACDTCQNFRTVYVKSNHALSFERLYSHDLVGEHLGGHIVAE